MLVDISNLIPIALLAANIVRGISHDRSGHFLNEFVIETRGVAEAKRIAEELGFTYEKAVSCITNIYDVNRT